MRIILSFLLALSAFGAVTVDVVDTTSTQAVIVVRGASTACTLTLREGSTSGTIHPDVSAVTDTGRYDTLVKDAGRVVTLGRERGNLALSADTDWFGTVSGCGTATFTFRTKPGPPLGAMMPKTPPYLSTRWDGLNMPNIDWTTSTGRGKWYTDPTTGLKVKLLSQPGDFGYISSGDDTPLGWSGGSGWTSPGNAADSSDSTYATVSGTNPFYLHPDFIRTPYEELAGLEDIGVVLRGGSCSSTGSNCNLKIGIGVVGGAMEGTPITVSIPTSANAALSSGNTYAQTNGAYPATFPAPLFSGWGTGITWPVTARPISGTLAATSGTLTIASPSATNHFPISMVAGSHIYVAGSGCTAAGATDVCVVAAAGTTNTITVTESITVASGTAFKAYPRSLIFQKETGTGTFQISAKTKIAFAEQAVAGPAGISCSLISFLDADGVRGNLCSVSNNRVYFISDDGEVVRPLIRVYNTSVGNFGISTIRWSTTDAKVFYGSKSGTPYKCTYSGDGKTSFWNTTPGQFYMQHAGLLQPANQTEYITCGSMLSSPLEDQVETLFPAFVAAPFAKSDWASGVQFSGVSGNTVWMYKEFSSSQDVWSVILAINATTGVLFDMIDTMNSGDKDIMYSGLHNLSPVEFGTNSASISLHHRYGQHSSGTYGNGPFRFEVTHVKRGGSWHANTCLEWPVGTTNRNSQCGVIPAYDMTCTGTDPYKSFGGDLNQCVTVKVSGPPYNARATTWDRTMFGDAVLYPGDTTKSAVPFPQVGALIGLFTTNGTNNGDNGKMRLLKITNLGDGTYELELRRNAISNYCCHVSGATPAGFDCECSDAQMQLADQWKAMIYSGTAASCTSTLTILSYPVTQSPAGRSYAQLSNIHGGHYTWGLGQDDTNYMLLATTYAFSPANATELSVQPPVPGAYIPNPSFQGVDHVIGGGEQQYYDKAFSSEAPKFLRATGTDANAVNPSAGSTNNNLGNGINSTSRTFTNVTGNIWKVSITGHTNTIPRNDKTRPYTAWLGARILQPISGPGSDITAAADYTYCIPYVNGECYSGSLASDNVAYVKAPGVYKYTGNLDICHTGMEFAATLCVYSMNPSAGYIREFRANRTHSGYDQRLLSAVLRNAGAHFPYYSAKHHPGGKLMLAFSATHLEGNRMAHLVIKLPPFPETTRQVTGLGGLTVSVPARAGATHARIRFGYDGTAHCTERNQDCATDATANTTSNPFVFVGTDTLNATPCSSGCTIPVPVWPGSVVDYWIDYLGSASTTTLVGATVGPFRAVVN